jgi:EAL domain-containing protein (putative c-di-GMP-specific phosphodiesterase class I)
VKHEGVVAGTAVKQVVALPTGQHVIAGIAEQRVLAGTAVDDVVAGATEPQAQLQRVRAEGCTEVQGYLFSRPIPASDIAAVLATREIGTAKVA